jgi:hypothetical protein
MARWQDDGASVYCGEDVFWAAGARALCSSNEVKQTDGQRPRGLARCSNGLGREELMGGGELAHTRVELLAEDGDAKRHVINNPLRRAR